VKTTDPAGEKPPLNVAESETLPPAGTEPEGVVEMDGVAFVTTTVSLPQGDVTALFVVSPLYVATQLYVPTPPAGTLLEEAVLLVSVPVVVAVGVVQVVSPGANSWKVTLPPGFRPPETVAVSETLPPAGTDPDGVVVMLGLYLVTLKGSAPHPELTALLFGSPPYVATQLYVPGLPTATLPDEALPPARMASWLAIGVWQVVSPGANSWKVTLPPGLRPPAIVAESEATPPAGTGSAAVVEMEGLAFTHVFVAEATAAQAGPGA
jgi:hypothetical protein